MSVYPLYKEIFPPTSVEEVVCANFTSYNDVNVIVARTSFLQIYKFVEIETTVEDDLNGEDDNSLLQGYDKDDDQNFPIPTLKPAKSPLTMIGHLELVAQYKLHGNITSMGVVRTISAGANGMDSLLLTFKDAKMSLLEYSLATNSIVTVSIHYYEREEFKLEFLSNTHPTELRVDPFNRCAVMNFFDDKLAILPFRQEVSSHLDKEEMARKWPYLPSFVIELSSIQPRIKNVIDMRFLHDFYEPTLAILFEPCQTWPGKLNSTKDSCSLVVVSLLISQKAYPIIQSMDNLPHSCVKLISIPKPVGGILIISANAIIHVNQSSKGIGVAVNGYASSTTDFSLDHSFEHLGLALEGLYHVFLDSDEILFILRNGDLYIVKLIIEERSLTKIELKKVGTSTLPSCSCLVANGYFFVGSRLGDSYFIKYTKTNTEHKTNSMINGFDNKTRKNTSDSDADAINNTNNTNNMNNANNADDANNSNNTNNANSSDGGNKAEVKKSTISDYQFTICNTITNVGPIVDMAYGELAFSEEEAHLHSVHKNLELVSCSGYGSASSLCIFHRNINPTLSNSFTMKDCINMWAVSCRSNIFRSINLNVAGLTNNTFNGNTEDYDKFLFISKKNRTMVMVLACGEELQELENSDFYTEGPTLAVGTLLNGTRILQVYAYGIRLFDQDGKLVQIIQNDIVLEKDQIVFANIVDPYVLLLFDNDNINLMKIEDDKSKLEFHPPPSQINEIPTKSCCIYRDDTNIFAFVKDVAHDFSNIKDQFKNNQKRNLPEKPQSPGSEQDDLHDDIDETSKKDTQNIEMDIDDKEDSDKPSEEDKIISDEMLTGIIENPKKESYWCVLYRLDGSLELPEFEEVFHFPHFYLSPAVLADFKTRQNVKSSGQTVEIQEILLINIGQPNKYPYLIAHTNVGDIIIYKAFRYIPGIDVTDPFQKSQIQYESDNRLAIRFSRVSHEYISRETIYSDIHDKPVSRKSTQDLNNEELNISDNDVERYRVLLRHTKRRLIPFTNISGFSGIFVTGVKPLWLICADNNYLRVHPMNADGEIHSFTQFHNVHCVHGFLYTNNEDLCRLSELPKDFKYHMEWPVKKIPLGRSVHGIEYHPEMQVYALLTSSPVDFILLDDNGESVETEQDSAFFLPETQKFVLELISPITWETVDRHEFQDDEQGLCIKCVSLQTKSTSSGRKSFIAIGTGFFRGEDVGMRGNVYIFEIIEVVPEPDNPQTNHKYKLLCHEEVKGSVTAICDVNGYLLTCVGPKIFIRAFEDNDRLISVAFIDIQIYANSVVSIKDYILLGDVYKSVWFLGFQEEPAKLVLVGKDYHALDVSCSSFIIDEPVLYFVVADMDRNIHLFQYSPYNVQSFAGQKLIRRGDFHIGGQIKTIISLPKKELIRKDFSFDQSTPSRWMEEENNGYKQLCLCGTLDGSIGMITPIPEKMYKRMQLLHVQMVNGIQHPAAINPAKGILDGDLLMQFPNLALHRQREMTKQIGTTIERIMDDLLVVQESCDYF
ncbi:10709_t:CDS:10 [Diversispora eburnea]|uniref:10709_t:CDS:1 n=1 Tax=Diversispora eburnea TaxID=1213867 RepID=A0A9N8V2W0_9GLOM|nr:10709_t:CDS:10 [Diversispora eburnea]